MQLVAYGAQDIYLTGNPQITFFKVVYRRHTNFSMEAIEQTISGSQSVSGSGTVTISRNGDLVHKVYVTCAMTEGNNGNEIIDNIELEIGGQRIDKQTSEWNQIWADLSTPESKADGFKCMTGACNIPNVNAVGEVHVPLNFWFCRNAGLALPLIALQYHEVKLKCVWGTAVGTRKVVADYIYLDTDERRRFAQVSHEYLIEQIQEQSADASGDVKLNFNHPVKELIWTSNITNSYGTALLKLNGHERFSAQQEEYFQLRQPYDYHTSVPGQNIVLTSRPQLLATPIDVGIHDHHGATPTDDGTTVTLTGSTITFSTSLTDPAGITIFNKVKIGDLVAISVGAGTGGSAADTNTHFAQITQINTSTNVVTYSPTWDGDNFPGMDNTDGVSLTVIARAQDPVSRTGRLNKKINVYSFALKPEDHQPSGTCNFSRIDTARLETNSGLETGDNIYAVNYNVLRIMSGMGGLAYSN